MNAVDALARVQAETLIIHRREDRLMPFEAGRRLAAGLPQTRFMTLEGKAHPPWVDGRAIADIVHSFLAGEDPLAAASSPEFLTARATDCGLDEANRWPARTDHAAGIRCDAGAGARERARRDTRRDAWRGLENVYRGFEQS
jgi:hypothetical protein